MATTGTTPETGASLRGEIVLQHLIRPLLGRAVVPAMIRPERVIVSPAGEAVIIPKIASAITADPWKDPGELIDEVAVGWDNVELLPASLRSLKSLHRVAAEVVRQRQPEFLAPAERGPIEEPLGASLLATLVWELSLLLDAAFLTGDGDRKPLGLLNQTGAAVMSAGGGPLTVDHIITAVSLAEAANANPSHVVMHPLTAAQLRRERSGSGGAGLGEYLLTTDPALPFGASVAGMPLMLSTAMPAPTAGAGVALVADHRQLVVAVDGGAEVAILRETFGATDEIGLRTVLRADIAALNGEGLVLIEDIGPIGGLGSGS